MGAGLRRRDRDAKTLGDGGGLQAFVPQGDEFGFLLGGGHSWLRALETTHAFAGFSLLVRFPFGGNRFAL
jgi:hypothetical protein